jgi:hypothetical protein
MDPFIESNDWEDFHANMITAIQSALVPLVRPDYSVRTERRIYIDHPSDAPSAYRADIAVIHRDDPLATKEVRQSTVNYESATYELVPVERLLPGPVDVVENYLVIRHLGSGEVVTVIELLSPSNKRFGSEGRKAYLGKREEILSSRTNLVELDLLRGGARLPTVQPLPPGDYFAFVCRSKRRRVASVYAWPLEHRLPVIPIPLVSDAAEVALDLQHVFNDVYDRAGYDYSLKYETPLAVPLNEAHAQWALSLLEDKSKGLEKEPPA